MPLSCLLDNLYLFVFHYNVKRIVVKCTMLMHAEIHND